MPFPLCLCHDAQLKLPCSRLISFVLSFSSAGRLYVLMEFCDAGSLLDLISRCVRSVLFAAT